jgi:RNA polymerase sigma factor (sigma-70 family)
LPPIPAPELIGPDTENSGQAQATLTDQEIIERFLAGQADATGVLREWIRGVVRYSGGRSQAGVEDLEADALYRLLGQLRAGRFRADSSLKTYVCRIARFTLVDFIRREQRARAALQRYEPPESPVKTPEQEYSERRRGELLSRVFDLADANCRRLWHMIFVDRLDYAAIAQRLGSNPAAIKVRVFRCKEDAVELVKRLERRLPAGGSSDHITEKGEAR